jgi:AmmeMemoRadiSam system protein A
MDKPLTTHHQTVLLTIARKAIETCVLTGDVYIEPREEKALNTRQGCFVSIKQNERLRGCIGNFQSEWPLYREVAEMACAAATKDPRFYPMTKEDLQNFQIEISVLSPLQKITAYDDIMVGEHGIYLEKGYHRGVLLPQVAVEYGWDRMTFLSQTCTKAGLPADAWKSEDADIYIFNAQIFGDTQAGAAQQS